MIEADRLLREIRRLKRRYAAFLEEVEAAHEAPSTWELEAETLCWHVVLRDVLEPDVDLELLEDAVVVRGAVEERVRLTVLPVPAPFDVRHPEVSLRGEVLEVRVFVKETRT